LHTLLQLLQRYIETCHQKDRTADKASSRIRMDTVLAVAVDMEAVLVQTLATALLAVAVTWHRNTVEVRAATVVRPTPLHRRREEPTVLIMDIRYVTH